MSDSPIVDAVPVKAAPVPYDTRSQPDRRKSPTPMLSRYALFGGRRRAGRRPGENDNSFVDVHGPALFAVVLGVVLLNFLDAWFTILFLSHGGQEMNPFVDEVLQWGPWPFILLKSAGIGLCVLFLTLAKNFRIAKLGLGVVLAGYLLLLCWHVVLYMRLEDGI